MKTTTSSSPKGGCAGLFVVCFLLATWKLWAVWVVGVLLLVVARSVPFWDVGLKVKKQNIAHNKGPSAAGGKAFFHRH